MSKTVFVGLSGGVDSAVSAALLKERGYNVVGAFIKIWQPEFLECSWKEDRLDAMRVCAALGIPFREVDLSDEYQREVVQEMITAYSRGVTPNPDVLCNRSIKFGHFATWAFENGADMIATGHYARVEEKDGQFNLLRGIDTNKDQSYFLYRLDQKDLSRVLFPAGDYKKLEIRKLAEQFNLPVAKKHDSQGLCFVGDVSMKEFLARFITLQEGAVLDEQGNEIGTHDGAALYTIGERHGFSGAGGVPEYVVSIDTEKNILHVSADKTHAMRSALTLSSVHWINEPKQQSFAATAQARYRETPFDVEIANGPRSDLKGSRKARTSDLVVRFKEPRIAAPGQSLVFYNGDVCLGGGVINRSS